MTTFNPSKKLLPLLFAGLFSLTIIATPSVAFAGGFGGPPPFRNGSPLISGIDGSYQATARGQNVTGIFRFQYANGSQTTASNPNSWVFFVNGEVQRGRTDASIAEGSVSGVLDSLNLAFSTGTNGSVALPAVFVDSGTTSSGEFSGKIDLSSPDSTFKGNGRLLASPGSTNTLTIVSTNAAGFPFIATTTFTNGSGTNAAIDFSFRGVRTSTSTTVSTTSSSSTN